MKILIHVLAFCVSAVVTFFLFFYSEKVLPDPAALFAPGIPFAVLLGVLTSRSPTRILLFALSSCLAFYAAFSTYAYLIEFFRIESPPGFSWVPAYSKTGEMAAFSSAGLAGAILVFVAFAAAFRKKMNFVAFASVVGAGGLAGLIFALMPLSPLKLGELLILFALWQVPVGLLLVFFAQAKLTVSSIKAAFSRN